MNALSIKALIIREYWENRGLLFKTPLIISLILLILASIGTYQAVKFAPWKQDGGSFRYEHSDGSSFKFDDDYLREKGWTKGKNNFEKFGSKTDSDVAKIKSTILAGIVSLALAISFFLSLFYLSSSLYQDRKDRSILFWRSLPVTEWETITSKLITGVWIFPLIYCGFALVATFIATIIIYLGALALGLDSIVKDILFELESYSISTFFQIILAQFIFTTSLLPLYSWILFSSAFSKRSPMLIAIGIPVAMIIAEMVLLHSSHFGTALFKFFSSLYFNSEAIARFELGGINWVVYGIAVLASASLLIAAHWFRNNRYEI